MSDSFFHLSKKDPTHGFSCDMASIVGCIAGAADQKPELDNPVYLRLMLGSHLARYLRLKLEEDFQYTSTCGISTNKLLSKLVGSEHKPRNQTTLLAYTDEDVVTFVDGHKLRSIPGLGFKIARVLDSHVTSTEEATNSHAFESSVTARDVRLHPDVSPSFLESCLAGPGSERGIGVRVWNLLHGIDPTEVKLANDVPSQISIEDTYKGLETVPQILEELHKLSSSLIRRMRVDLLVPDEAAEEPGAQRWMAWPKTLRLSIRSWPQAGQNQSLNYSRISRSSPLPNFVSNLKADISALAEKLVSEALLPLLRRLQAEKGPKWNLQLINICVANMITGAGNTKTGAGRDIAVMFKNQDDVLRPWKVTDHSEEYEERSTELHVATQTEDSDPEQDYAWDATEQGSCLHCGRNIPSFAMAAHLRYHELG
jgi:DNA polymerase iota